MAFPGQSLDSYIRATEVTITRLEERGITRRSLSAEEGLLLQTLFYWAGSRPIYGRAIAEAINRHTGTVYPVLRRFECYGLLVSKLDTSAKSLPAPPRRLYTPTKFGYEILELFSPNPSS